MKIISKGVKRDGWGLKMCCTGKGSLQEGNTCFSTLLIEKEDILISTIEVSSYAGGVDFKEVCSFRCPICECETFFDSCLIRYDILSEVKNNLNPKKKSLEPDKK